MNRVRDLAISLRCVQFEERHRVVTALTENHGKISAMARNSIQSRRFGGSLEPFTAAQWDIVEKNGGEMFSVESAQVRRGFEGIRKDFMKLSLASVLNETMLTIAPEREACPDLFRLHANALAVIDEMDVSEKFSKNLVSVYLGKVLHWAGTQPRLSSCLECETALEDLAPEESLNFHIGDAGWICSSCRKTGTRHLNESGMGNTVERSVRVSAETLARLRWALAQKLKDGITMNQTEDGYTLILQLSEFHLPGFGRDRLKSFRFLGSESSLQLPALNRPLG
ncbi:MAG: DNA repair protein RecO [Bdellovibrionales bacterium]|nr:DNA repair protein RecO [Bdellovibrionales bacterium]